MTAMLAAVIALVMVALIAFSVIGTQKHPAAGEEGRKPAAGSQSSRSAR